MARIFHLWLFLVSSAAPGDGNSSPSPSPPPFPKLSGSVAGDVILGGLFPMHEYNLSRREFPCGAVKEEKGIQVSQKYPSFFAEIPPLFISSL